MRIQHKMRCALFTAILVWICIGVGAVELRDCNDDSKSIAMSWNSKDQFSSILRYDLCASPSIHLHYFTHLYVDMKELDKQFNVCGRVNRALCVNALIRDGCISGEIELPVPLSASEMRVHLKAGEELVLSSLCVVSV